jgi:hypothetical protein
VEDSDMIGDNAAGKAPAEDRNERRAMDRRSFFRGIGGASAVAATAIASPFAATEAEAYDPGSTERRGRYRETEHVKAFYRTNGYETLKK